tara:strand:- start:315 stop:494 length:180 start_codon:yes stop_codon:yes gene_type:complete
MDTTAKELIEDLNAILVDHKSQIIDMVKEDADEALLVDVEANLDRMTNEVNGLFDSAYL